MTKEKSDARVEKPPAPKPSKTHTILNSQDREVLRVSDTVEPPPPPKSKDE